MKSDIKKFKSLKYIISYPSNFKSGVKYPVILFLHGAGSRGTDISVLEGNPYFNITKKYTDFPFVTVAPQCNADTWFDVFGELTELTLSLKDFDFTDAGRIYAMGASMGGYGVWQLAMSLPDVFAAIVPICGGGMYWNAGRLKNVRIWAFHGSDDPAVLPRESIEMVNRAQKAGADAKYTIYDNTGHDAWTATYSNPEVFSWLLQSKKGGGAALEKNVYDSPEKYG